MELSDAPEKIPSDWESIPGPNSLDVPYENQVLTPCSYKEQSGNRQTFLYKEMLPLEILINSQNKVC